MTDHTPDPEVPGHCHLVPENRSQPESSLRLLQIPALADNYLWLLADTRGRALAIDPGCATAIEAALQQHQLQLAAIALTHHHPDHIGGVAKLTANRKVPVYGPADPRMPVNQPVSDGDAFEFSGVRFSVLDLAGHTRSHLGFYDGLRLFCGDTLFVLGCGRLFEGSATQMWAALERIMALPESTLICCAHEYTQANLRFARALFPQDPALEHEQRRIEALRAVGKPTVPSTLEHELALNPFLRMRDSNWRRQLTEFAVPDAAAPAFARIRMLKDEFR